MKCLTSQVQHKSNLQWIYSAGNERLKGLELVNSVSEELWMEVCNIVQEAENKTTPKGKKGKKS